MPKVDAPQELGRTGSSRAWNEAAHALAVLVQKARSQRHMSSLALAEQSRLSERIIEDIESGHPVEQSAVEAVCRTLGLPIPKLDGDPVHTFALLIRQRREQAR